MTGKSRLRKVALSERNAETSDGLEVFFFSRRLHLVLTSPTDLGPLLTWDLHT
jgi:hypothetical protein